METSYVYYISDVALVGGGPFAYVSWIGMYGSNDKYELRKTVISIQGRSIPLPGGDEVVGNAISGMANPAMLLPLPAGIFSIPCKLARASRLTAEKSRSRRRGTNYWIINVFRIRLSIYFL